MIPRFLGAVQFLTIIPVRCEADSPGRSAVFFPLVGAALGAIGGVAFQALIRCFSSERCLAVCIDHVGSRHRSVT